MARAGSYTRSAARATSSAFRARPIRWRLAGGSALLTLVILAAFAGVVGVLTTRQVRRQFETDVSSEMNQLYQDLSGKLGFINVPSKLGHHLEPGTLNCNQVNISSYSFERAQIRVFVDGNDLCDQSGLLTRGASAVLPVFNTQPAQEGAWYESDYRVETRRLPVRRSEEALSEEAFLLYARPESETNHTLARIRFFLLAGVIGGTILALLAGLAIAQRAMRPIRELTDAAREIERTRDPSRHVPHPRADDEIAELARTLEGMLGALDSARADTEAMLHRQREFVADASHELRTPLTSVLANLELLAEELDGEQADTAQAAQRSPKRMRRLVGDLLLLARADAKRVQPVGPIDVAVVRPEAASELGPMAGEHQLSLDAQPVVVPGVRDDLHRLTLNLIENGLRHTPPGTHISASTRSNGADAMIIVEDDGPGIPADMRGRVFDRFVRSGHGSGLGLAIVRAVAESHGGSVSLEQPPRGHGTRLVVRLPLERDAVRSGTATNGAQTSTTTGSTIGRRRSRS
jgi:two-component system, OmpR family, sensor kinase